MQAQKRKLFLYKIQIKLKTHKIKLRLKNNNNIIESGDFYEESLKLDIAELNLTKDMAEIVLN